jgi:hypothetical protein
VMEQWSDGTMVDGAIVDQRSEWGWSGWSDRAMDGGTMGHESMGDGASRGR